MSSDLSRRDWLKSATAIGLLAGGPDLTLGVTAAAGAESNVIDIGSRRELFVDEHLIEKLDGARLVLHHPTTRHDTVDHDLPWEGNIPGYHTVFQDGDIYRLYYRGAQWDKRRKLAYEVTCYAESKDGIEWTKPQLGLFEFDGSKANNIVWSGPGTHNFTPFKDANPACQPDERYKALGRHKGGLIAFKSPDGIHWSLVRETPVITKGAFDSQNLAFWDTVRHQYVEFHRGFRRGVRDIMTCTSEDFRTWSDPVWLSYPGSQPEHLYTNAIVPYYRTPHIFLGFPRRYMASRRGLKGEPGLCDGLFISSRDGLEFKRWAEAFIRPGPQPVRWLCRNTMTAWGILETKSHLPGAPNELSLYTSEGGRTTGDRRLRRHTIRIDGFVSVHAPLSGGRLLTKPIVFSGKELKLNFSTSAAGSIRVGIRDAAGAAIPGCELAACPEIFGDELERTVVWPEGKDLSALSGTPVRLCFELKDADLYSFQFT